MINTFFFIRYFEEEKNFLYKYYAVSSFIKTLMHDRERETSEVVIRFFAIIVFEAGSTIFM